METANPEALLLSVHSIVVCRSCKVSDVADVPTTVLRTVPSYGISDLAIR